MLVGYVALMGQGEVNTLHSEDLQECDNLSEIGLDGV